MAEKSKSIVQKHPEVNYSAVDYFHDGRNRVIEESVNRGDARRTSPRQYDITDEDIKKLAKAAIALVDKRLLDDDRSAAVADAVHSAIYTMDDGTWQGKVSASTFDILCEQADKLLTSAKEDKIQGRKDQNERVLKIKSPAEEVQGKEASSKKKTEEPEEESAPKTKALVDDKVIVFDGPNKARELKPSGRSVNLSGHKTRDVLQNMSRKVKNQLLKKASSEQSIEILAQLEDIAGKLQDTGNVKLASMIDMVSNTIESSIKQASEMLQNEERF